jgi:hypothetical protein
MRQEIINIITDIFNNRSETVSFKEKQYPLMDYLEIGDIQVFLHVDIFSIIYQDIAFDMTKDESANLIGRYKEIMTIRKIEFKNKRQLILGAKV